MTMSDTRLFVGNIPDKVDEKVLKSAFSTFGQIVNIELKSKPGEESSNKFAFVTLSASNYEVESCIRNLSTEGFMGNKLYVTRARESFLERLKREREQAQEKDKAKDEPLQPVTEIPIIKLDEKLNPRKRKFFSEDVIPQIKEPIQDDPTFIIKKKNILVDPFKNIKKFDIEDKSLDNNVSSANKTKKDLPKNKDFDKKKMEADKKRMESMKQKRQEFNEKKQIIKFGLTGVDKTKNKKLVFSDSDDETKKHPKPEINTTKEQKQQNLFDGESDSDDQVDFAIKEQFEGKKGQKALELQSRYKSDKRFVLDERFIENQSDEERVDESVDTMQSDEKDKQMNILQDVLGIAIKHTPRPDMGDKKKKPRLGMLRFDPLQPEHSKFLAPVEVKPENTNKNKKNKNKNKNTELETKQETETIPNGPTVEVSKEQFYNVSDKLKEAIAQPNTFSLRSLFGKNEEENDSEIIQDPAYIPLEGKQKEDRVKNPLEPNEKNPFVYDSSESENEEEVTQDKEQKEIAPKSVWRENLFFSVNDQRLLDGLQFFNTQPELNKERREMKSVMKKRLFNKSKKEQMFKKKIGGRRKTHTKNFKNKK